MCLLMLVFTFDEREYCRAEIVDSFVYFSTPTAKSHDQTSFTSFAYRWPIWHATEHIVGESFTVNFTHIFEMNSPENYKREAIKEHHMFVTKMKWRKRRVNTTAMNEDGFESTHHTHSTRSSDIWISPICFGDDDDEARLCILSLLYYFAYTLTARTEHRV